MVNKIAAIRRESTTDTIISRLVTNLQLGTREGKPYKRSLHPSRLCGSNNSAALFLLGAQHHHHLPPFHLRLLLYGTDLGQVGFYASQKLQP